MKKHSHPTSWPIILGIALLATGTQTVKAAQPEPTQQAAPSTDPSADIKELETMHLAIQSRLAAIHDRGSADKTAEWLHANRLKWAGLVASLRRTQLPTELEKRKLDIQHRTGLLLLQYTSQFAAPTTLIVSDSGVTNARFHGSDKLLHTLYACFAPVNAEDTGMYHTPPLYKQLLIHYGMMLRAAESMFAHITNQESAESTAKRLYTLMHTMQTLQARMQTLAPFPRWEDTPPFNNIGYMPLIRKHILQLSETDYHESLALKLICETIFLPPSGLSVHQELLAQQECDLYTVIQQELASVHDKDSAENTLLLIRPWLQKLDSLHTHFAINCHSSQTMPARCQKMCEYGSAFTDTCFHLMQNNYYNAPDLQKVVESLIRNLPTHAELYRHDMNDEAT
ncbi:hypothetical protein [Akkermansia glycaniphila]|uniref:Secreted protein n=1 Tax=Akkermansia glycaniphila TaxID=1679444 RepID=A0A1C7PAY3_9BACT|nr:hypothetical protein [Akkermansia glycaniphila]OCA02494.1 hypothetical protein AC781_09800 [Akkermansia glycaniphila]SEH90001.1 Hypothetical protein PYTT_1554 [Akkermansia glycaniphila]